MNRELNELKSTAINRTGLIGTVINTPEAPRGAGSAASSVPGSRFATKKGKERLRPGAAVHSHSLDPSPYDKGPNHVSRNIEEESLGTKQCGGSLEEPGVPCGPSPATLDERCCRGREAGPGASGAPRSLDAPAHPLAPALLGRVLTRGRSSLPARDVRFISSSGIHTITWAVAK